MALLLVLLQLALAAEPAELAEQIESTRAEISARDKMQREALSQLYAINRKIKDISRKRARLNDKLLEREGAVRALAQEVEELGERTNEQKEALNQRLRRLYQERRHDDLRWLFSSRSPVEFDRNQRYLRKMVDGDHRRLREYIGDLRATQRKREELKRKVAELVRTRREVDAQEREVAAQMKEKGRLLAELQRSRALKLNELKDLRAQHGTESLAFAFFEKKGSLRPPVAAPVRREFGTYVDPKFRFRLMHKGIFFDAKAGSDVNAIADGVVALASTLPGYGKAVILDHGDNYYSFYGFNRSLKVREGARVREGEVIAAAGATSPLFGPGVYFEIRHFTDAIDPRSWIKEPVVKAANP